MTCRAPACVVRRTVKDPRIDDRAWLRARYEDDGCTTVEIAKELNCSPATVCRAFERLGIPLRDKGKRSRMAWGVQPIDDKQVARLYLNGASTNDLTVIFRASKQTIFTSLRRCNVKMRTKSEAGKLHRSVASRRRPEPRKLVGASECAVCGTSLRLEAHHINADRSDNRPENLMWLCWEHHVLVEWLVNKAVTGIRRRVIASKL